MTYGIVASKLDVAAINISEKLILKYGFTETNQNYGGEPVLQHGDILLIQPNVDNVRAVDLDEHFNVAGYAFASRHRSETGEATLTVHAPGNTTAATTYGGRPSEVAWVWAQRMKTALMHLMKHQTSLSMEYRVSLEATHHGPTELSKPVWFVEIGSTSKNWLADEAANLVAEALWLSVTETPRGKAAVGFGGGHYAPKQTKLTFEEEWAVGHILSKHAMQNIDLQIINQMFRKTYGECNTAILDWKGLKGEQRQRLLTMLKELDIQEIIKT